MLTPEELLEWADKVRDAQLTEEQEWLKALDKAIEELRELPSPPITPGFRIMDCGCPPYGTCMNTACPRRMQIWSGTFDPDWQPSPPRVSV